MDNNYDYLFILSCGVYKSLPNNSSSQSQNPHGNYNHILDQDNGFSYTGIHIY